jgi:hypothetical protein
MAASGGCEGFRHIEEGQRSMVAARRELRVRKNMMGVGPGFDALSSILPYLREMGTRHHAMQPSRNQKSFVAV